jgi:L-alanine-DL-glutamate epimerase-like enolase superfamily enzyme
MKIARVESHLVRLPFDKGGPVSPGEPIGTHLDTVLVRIDTDDGITGWGDAFGYGAAPATKAAVDHMIGPSLVGRDATDIAGLSHALQFENHLWGRYGVTLFAISGVDIALWDIAGKAAGLPLYRLLGGARRKRIPAYASLFHYTDPEVVAERCHAAVAQGFRHVKLHERAEREVRAAREALGEHIALMIDTNCPWTPLQARAMAERFALYDPYWLEEPIFPPEDFDSLAQLQAEIGIPLAAGENACTAFQFQQMIEAGAATFLQPSVTKVGGVTEFRKILALAETQGTAVAPHCPYFGPGLLASLHLLATMPDESLAEHFFYKSMTAHYFGDATKPVDGHIAVPEGPGLGHDPDPDVIREFGVK